MADNKSEVSVPMENLSGIRPEFADDALMFGGRVEDLTPIPKPVKKESLKQQESLSDLLTNLSIVPVEDWSLTINNYRENNPAKAGEMKLLSELLSGNNKKTQEPERKPLSTVEDEDIRDLAEVHENEQRSLRLQEELAEPQEQDIGEVVSKKSPEEELQEKVKGLVDDIFDLKVGFFQMYSYQAQRLPDKGLVRVKPTITSDFATHPGNIFYRAFPSLHGGSGIARHKDMNLGDFYATAYTTKGGKYVLLLNGLLGTDHVGRRNPTTVCIQFENAESIDKLVTFIKDPKLNSKVMDNLLNSALNDVLKKDKSVMLRPFGGKTQLKGFIDQRKK